MTAEGNGNCATLDTAPCSGRRDKLAEALRSRGDAEALVNLADRVVELEARLRRIARELEDAGVMTAAPPILDVDRFPTLADLTTKQREITLRLLRGQRVPTIARELYLSSSTVRNHLSTIFHKLGVHSQAELLAMLSTAREHQ